MIDVAIPPAWKRQWDELTTQLRDPFKLRVAMLSAVAGFGLLGIYRPMSSDISILRRDLKLAKERLGMVREIDQLRTARAKLLENFPEHGDINFWTEYVLSGVRECGVSLRTRESSFRKTKVGKLQGVYFDLEVTGSFEQIHALLAWIESNKFFARVVKLRMKSDEETIESKLMVATLVSQHAPKKAPAGAAGSKQAKTGEAQIGEARTGEAQTKAPVSEDAKHGY